VVVAAASTPNQGAQAFAPKKHGMFTYFLLAGLDPATRPADKDKDGIVTVEEMLDFAATRTVEETELAAYPQNPMILGTLEGKVAMAGSQEIHIEPAAEEEGGGGEPEGGGTEETPPEEPGDGSDEDDG
jgi:hypothetical protein